MIKPINIYSKEHIVMLDRKKYRIFLLGGFHVKLNEFEIFFLNLNNSKLIKAKKSYWHVQNFSHNKRAKRILSVDIPLTGEYFVIFKNQDSLKVKHSNLLFIKWMQSYIDNQNLEVLVTSKYGFRLTID